MKILIIKFRNIGDVLLATPLIENLKTAFPQSSIDFALNKNCVEMVSLNPLISELIIYDREAIKKKAILNRIKTEIAFAKQIRDKQYDLVISLTEGDRGALLALFSRAGQRIGVSPKNKLIRALKPFTQSISAIPKIHTVEKDLFPLSLLNIKPTSKKISIFWDKKVEAKVNQLMSFSEGADYVHIHPVARWMFKCWDDVKFAKIIDYLELERKMKVVVTASPDKNELDKVKNILSYCQSSPINLSGKLTLQEVAYVSSRAKFFFGVDTAPMHMAAAVNTPVRALFGPSLPHVWGPWDNDKLESNFKDIRVNQINGKHAILQKENDKIIWIDGIKISTSLMAIEVEDVKQLLN